MKLSILLPATMMVAAVMAADPGPILRLPPCPRGCVNEGLQNSRRFGCSFPSAQCLCRNKAYQDHLNQCSQKCSPAERNQMRDVGNKYCQDSGVPPLQRRNEKFGVSEDSKPEVEQIPIPTGIPPIPTIPVPTAIPTAIPTIPPIPTAVPPIPTAIPPIPTAVPPIPTAIPPIPPIPTAIPPIPTAIPPIPTAIPTAIPPGFNNFLSHSASTAVANENTNQAEFTPLSRVMRGKKRF